jgi:hypothetical protein
MSIQDRPNKSEADITVVVPPLTTVHVSRSGRAFQCIAADADGVVQIGLSQAATAGRFIYQGMGETLNPGEPDFDFVEFYNTSSGTSHTITIQTSYGDITDSRFNLVAGSLPSVISGADTNATSGQVACAAGVATQIWAGIGTGDNNGKIQNIGAHDVWIGYANTVTNLTGILLPAASAANADGNYAGAFLDGLSCRLTIYAYAVAGKASTVAYLQQGN